MCDNGETCEGEGARTDARLRGSGLYLYSAVRSVFLIEKVLPTWPRLKRMRIVTIGVEEMRKQPDFDMLPNALRVRVDVVLIILFLIFLNDYFGSVGNILFMSL